MIVKNFTDMKVERHKIKLHLKGDVYIWSNHFIESLESHKKLYPNSKARTIEQAYAERVSFEQSKEVENA